MISGIKRSMSKEANGIKFALRFACVYQIIIWIITGIEYVTGIFDEVLPKKDPFSLVSNLCVICLSIVCILSNLYLLFNKNDNKNFVVRNLLFNKWMNFAEIVNISIMGLSYNMIIGFHIIGYYLYDESQKFGMSFNYYHFTVDASLSSSNIIFVGISVIPLILFMIFNKVISEYKERDMYNSIPRRW